MQKKKILIFIDWFLPGYKAGGPVRSMANLAEYLKEEYEFYIYTSDKDHDGAQLEVHSDRWIEYNEGAAHVYYSTNPSFGEVKNVIREVKSDVVYLNSVFSLNFTVFPLFINRFFGKIRIPKVVFAPRGMFQKGALQLKASKKRAFLSIVKPLLFNTDNIVWHATDEQEVQDIKVEIGKKAQVQQVGNIPTTNTKDYNIVLPKDEIRFVTISLVAKKKNHIYFLELLKGITVPKGKKLVYDIYGPIKDEAYWQQCEEVIKELPEKIEVNYKGSVIPTQVSETLQAYHYFVLPTLGENFGHAIFEALINGVPVLLSDQTPWLGLEELNAGWSLALDKKDLWKEELEKLFNNEFNYHEVQNSARLIARQYINEQDFKKAYKKFFES